MPLRSPPTDSLFHCPAANKAKTSRRKEFGPAGDLLGLWTRGAERGRFDGNDDAVEPPILTDPQFDQAMKEMDIEMAKLKEIMES